MGSRKITLPPILSTAISPRASDVFMIQSWQPSTRRHGEVSGAEVEAGLGGHFLDKFARVNELVAKPRMNFWIEYLSEPIDGQSTARRLARIGVIGKPNVQMVSRPDVHRNDRGAERDRKCGQHTDSGALFDGVEVSRAGVGAYGDNVVDALNPEGSGNRAFIQPRRQLLNDPVILQVISALGHAKEIKILLGRKGMHMKPAELHDDEIRGSGHGELDSHVGFKAEHVGTFHRALQIDDDE